jgi:DNA-binding LacI/PurR family transcriptional regulator
MVPGDMSIIGFDGLAIGELLAPPLASVCTPNRDIGSTAWRRLMARIEGADDGESLSLQLPHSVRMGGTIGALSSTGGSSLPERPAV